jgi:Replication initiation factor
MTVKQLDLRSFFRLNILRGEIDYPPTPVTDITPELVPEAGVCNTPLESHKPASPLYDGIHPKVDGITFLYNCSDIRCVIVRMYEIWGITYDESEIREDYRHRQTWFALTGSWGCRLEYRSVDAQSLRLRVSISGQRCSSLELVDIHTRMSISNQLPGFTCTRIDLNADDTTGTLNLDRIAELARTGGYARYSVATCIQSYGGAKAGQSIIFGGDKSLQKVVFYDKSAESQGKILGTRQELRLRGGKADGAFTQLCFCDVSEVSEIIRGWLAGCILLGQKIDANLDRFKVADFWKEWVSMLNSSPTRPPQPIVKTSVSRSLAWLERTCGKAIAIASTVFEVSQFEEFIGRIIEKGRSNIPESLIPEMIQFVEGGGRMEFGL